MNADIHQPPFHGRRTARDTRSARRRGGAVPATRPRQLGQGRQPARGGSRARAHDAPLGRRRPSASTLGAAPDCRRSARVPVPDRGRRPGVREQRPLGRPGRHGRRRRPGPRAGRPAGGGARLPRRAHGSHRSRRTRARSGSSATAPRCWPTLRFSARPTAPRSFSGSAVRRRRCRRRCGSSRSSEGPADVFL